MTPFLQTPNARPRHSTLNTKTRLSKKSCDCLETKMFKTETTSRISHAPPLAFGKLAAAAAAVAVIVAVVAVVLLLVVVVVVVVLLLLLLLLLL